MMVAAGDSNAPPPDYESGVLPIHYTSGTAHERVRLGGLEERELMLPRGLGPAEANREAHMYDDMRRIRTEALLPYVKERMERVWD